IPAGVLKVFHIDFTIPAIVLEVFHVCKTFQDIVPEWLSPVFSIPLKVLACITNLPSPPAPVFSFFSSSRFPIIMSSHVHLLYIKR
ncbi:MAG: hypothetical protein ACOCTU_06990, partial [Bacteroidota bacterium]